MDKKVVDEGKTTAIIAYITWVGLLIAFLMNNDKKNDFARFHIRQSLLLVLAGFVSGFVIWIPILGWLIGLALLIFWILGLVYAIQGQAKEVPVIGKFAQDWFKSI